MAYEIERQVIDLPIDRIKINPKNKQIHDDFDPRGRDAWLVEDIRANGIADPVTVFPNGLLDDGHRRLFSVKHLKRTTIPAIILKTTDEEAAYRSAQLACQMKIFAKCLLYREKISALVERCSKQRAANFKMKLGSSVADSNLVHQEWIKLETVLNVSRRNLTAGVKLLARIDQMRESDDPDQIELANRAEFIFRNQGIKPTLRMLGELQSDDGSDNEIDDLEPDCGAWRSDEDDDPAHQSKPTKRTPIKASRKAKDELRQSDQAAAAKSDDPLIAELMSDYGFQTEAELKSRLAEADAWARKHKLALTEVISEGGSEGYEAKIGPEQCEFVHRYTIEVMDLPGAMKSPARRKLVTVATALFAYSHPLLRRHVEAGDCEPE